jgi:N-acetyl-1-D-myo-inositol-2-amino-2-deoxy-alpha-D-glucopyranoside deacetylase
LLVHAHPDDESITTGATMARYAAAGVHVTLVTCTLGEQGEILDDEVRLLEATQADQLGGYRIGELRAALHALGVTDHRFLGGAGRFRDSGMLGTGANAHPRAFWRAASEPAVWATAVAAAVDVVREVRPQVVITYDDNGDYGHPDHVMAHRVATEAVRRAARPGGAGEPWQVAKLYWTATPRSVLAADREEVRGSATGFDGAPLGGAALGVPDDTVTTVVDADRFRDAKRAALAAHRTQVTVRGDFYALSNNVGRRISGVEHFRLVHGRPGSDLDAAGHECDLFDGLE